MGTYEISATQSRSGPSVEKSPLTSAGAGFAPAFLFVTEPLKRLCVTLSIICDRPHYLAGELEETRHNLPGLELQLPDSRPEGLADRRLAAPHAPRASVVLFLNPYFSAVKSATSNVVASGD